MVSQSVLGKISALLTWSPDRLIVKLISNIALSMREKYCWLKGMGVFRDGMSSLCRHANVPHLSVVQLQEETAR